MSAGLDLVGAALLAGGGAIAAIGLLVLLAAGLAPVMLPFGHALLRTLARLP